MGKPLLSGRVRRAGAALHYEIYGGGTPVLLLHGNGESLHAFDHLIPALAARHRLIALDTRGHGRSERGTAPFDFHTFAADAAAVLDALEIPSARIVGYSDGASTALHLALAAPEKVAALALLGANLSPGGILRRFQLPIELGYLVTGPLSRVSRRAARNRELLSLMTKHPNLPPEALGAIAAPALVLAGERDMVRRDHTETIAGAIPGAHLEILPGQDHFSLMKAPLTAERLLAFLAESHSKTGGTHP